MMITHARKYVWLMAFASQACLAMIACVNNPQDIPSFGKKQISTEEGKHVEVYYSMAAKLKAKLTAPFMLRHLTDSAFVEFPKSLHVDFFNDTMVIESKMDALYGKYREFENKVFLRDGVVVINVLKGDTLHTDELWWDQRTHKFYTDKKVRINTKDKIIFGTGLEASENFSWYVIEHITGTIITPENGLPK